MREPLDWLAQLTTHIPNRGEQMVRYYGYYSNQCRGQRKKAGCDEIAPAITEPEASLPSLLSVVKSHKRFTRYKEKPGAVPYLRSCR